MFLDKSSKSSFEESSIIWFYTLTEVFRDFVDVLSARTVVGHDADGNLVLFHVEGKTLERG